MTDKKCPYYVNNRFSHGAPHEYCRKTGKIALVRIGETLNCELCPYSEKK